MGNQKRSSGHVLRVTLMASSIVLLVLLQGYWLANSYEQSYIGFKREASALFRASVYATRDSVFSSISGPLPPTNTDTIVHITDSATGPKYSVTHMRKGGIRIQFRDIKEWNDSTLYASRRIMDSIERKHNIFIRVKDDDTLPLNALHHRFESVSRHSGYPYTFFLRHITTERAGPGKLEPLDIPPFSPKPLDVPANPLSDTLSTDRAFINPVNSYVAVYPGMRSNMIKKIMPQILFSVFLTTLTIATFVVMYRNLRSQERVMQMKNDFIGNVTHELKTPIATVSVALEALKDFDALRNPTRTAEYLDIAQHELNRLSLMTDKILNASVFEQQGVAYIPGVVKLDEIVKQVTESLKVVLDKKNIQTTVSLDGSSFELKGSEMHLTNVVFNLLDNAIKYSAANTTIEISLQSNEQEITLAIQDHGMGIDKLYHKRIFEKFFRVQQGDVHNTKGHGLGLNYVADVVHSHRGDISLESSLGQGSCFILRLPRNAG